ncbi:hypothetical protein PP485_gp80 [Gordonia phage ThankyouJordi]|uniref:Uncharacterized protein n=1 Tax=Gordonia phage ThankyouJordi TaxID=2571252 RepID=A0A4Y6EKH3_9CAUD|nr:hypothetical protein PP485_gp80 [Gordonia phage ThankyouJordi]QCW22265.1 hypothetical protein SEA_WELCOMEAYANNA_80 [Gordonia phage WelcomeAyanna]QDF17841.1 hypothetical protein SEA_THANKYOUJORDI_80 [Gordonia phage ThankyouJordi]
MADRKSVTYERAVAQVLDEEGRINTITETVDEEPDAPS